MEDIVESVLIPKDEYESLLEKGSLYGIGYDIEKYGMSDPDRMVDKYSMGNPNYLNDVYMRFYNICKDRNVEVYNLSTDSKTRLPYPHYSIGALNNEFTHLP